MAILPARDMHVTEQNAGQAMAARRDILAMYVDLVESYGGFGHNVDTGTFDALDFIDATIVEPPGHSFELNVGLLRVGAAVALLCDLLNAWDDWDAPPIEICEVMDESLGPPGRVHRLWSALKAGRLAQLPDNIRRAVALGFGKSEDAFRQQLKAVYDEQVVGYFRRLIADPG